MTHVTCRLSGKNWNQLRNNAVGNRVWAAFLSLQYTRAFVITRTSLSQNERVWEKVAVDFCGTNTVPEPTMVAMTTTPLPSTSSSTSSVAVTTTQSTSTTPQTTTTTATTTTEGNVCVVRPHRQHAVLHVDAAYFYRCRLEWSECAFGKLVMFCSVLWPSSRSEGWPHHGRTFSIYPCPLSFWLTLPRKVLSTSWCCLSRPCVVFLTWHCSSHHLFLQAAPCFSRGVTIVC